jgi:hypothetical protein
MSQQDILKPEGLYTFPNAFSQVPPGALETASNVVIDREGIVTSRRGFKAYSASLGATVTSVSAITSYQNKLICHVAGSINTLYKDDGTGTFSAFTGAFGNPSTDAGVRVRFVNSNKNLYFCSDLGVKKLAAISGTIIDAGAPRGFGGTGVTSGATGFMANNTNVAYRVVWGYKDANTNLILGVPGERIVVSNSAGATRNVDLTFQIPIGIDTTWFYQVYRSAASATLTDVPDDEMQQVYEANPSAAQITAKSVTLTDNVPDSLKQATLYTSPSQQGIANANYQPPFAQDMVLYKNHVMYANTRRKHSITITLIATGATGFNVGSTITFTNGTSPFTLTGAVAENAAIGNFQVYTAGTPAQNIENTARSLVKIMNTYASNTILNGYYASGFDQLPGQIFLESRTLDNVAISIVSTAGTAFTPIVPAAGTTVATTAEIQPNRIYVSKLQQPESVPLYRTIDVGTADQPIQRILALRDGVFILKPDGVFRISGDVFENFRLSLIDNTVKIVAPNSAVTLANQLFFMSSQGVVAVSDTTGALIVSRPIESTLLELSSSIYPNFQDATFAIAYESDRKFIMWTVTSTTDTVATQAFVYNILTKSWTNWDRTQTAGYVNPTDDKLYLAEYNAAGAAKIFQERKLFSRLDYCDQEYAVNVTSVSGVTIGLTTTVNVVAGMTLKQDRFESVVESVDSLVQITVRNIRGFLAGAAIVYQPILTSVKTVPIHGESPMYMKHWQELSLIFSDSEFDELNVNFQSDFSRSDNNVVIAAPGTNAWGSFVWGALPWGGGALRATLRYRTYIPREIARSNWIQLTLSTNQSFSSFSCNGYAVTSKATSPRMK